MKRRVLVLFVLPWLLWGCKEDAFHLSVRYKEIAGLEPGNRVVFDQTPVGHVAGISYEGEGRFLAHLVIERDFSREVTEHSKFFIAQDPEDPAERAVEMVRTGEGGSPLSDGAVVEGSTKSSASLEEEAAGELEEGLAELKEDFEGFVEDLKKVPESEEFKNLEEELGRLRDEMKRSGEAARETIEKEWLPKLQKELQDLRERLRDFGREEEVEPLETKMGEMREI